jgi:hypothetical protein
MSLTLDHGIMHADWRMQLASHAGPLPLPAVRSTCLTSHAWSLHARRRVPEVTVCTLHRCVRCVIHDACIPAIVRSSPFFFCAAFSCSIRIYI